MFSALSFHRLLPSCCQLARESGRGSPGRGPACRPSSVTGQGSTSSPASADISAAALPFFPPFSGKRRRTCTASSCRVGSVLGVRFRIRLSALPRTRARLSDGRRKTKKKSAYHRRDTITRRIFWKTSRVASALSIILETHPLSRIAAPASSQSA